MRTTTYLLALTLSAMLFAACAAPQGGGEASGMMELAFEKYTLSNGLEVVLHEDHSDPIVAVATVVHVGSARETPGRTALPTVS